MAHDFLPLKRVYPHEPPLQESPSSSAAAQLAVKKSELALIDCDYAHAEQEAHVHWRAMCELDRRRRKVRQQIAFLESRVREQEGETP